MRKCWQLFILFLMGALCCVIDCANRQSPSGGPEDKTGPSLVATSPASESVGVKTDVSIEITFSEWILPASVKGISIFPPTPLKTKVKGKRLLIRPLKRLNDSTTYHLVVTSGLKDLRNNPISTPLSIIFSTGPSLDSGSIGGCVSDPGRKELQPHVALFRAPFQLEDSGFCGTPSYLAQTDSNGLFSFTHIRTGTYHLLAYLDKNNDYHLKAGDEELYLPADSLVTIGDTLVKAMLYPSTFDTLRQTIASVTVVNNRTIMGNWKQPFDTLVNSRHPEFHLESFDSIPTRISAVFRQQQGSVKFILSLDTILNSTSYRLIYAMQSIFDTAVFIDTLRIDGTAPADTTPPFLVRYLPDKPAELRPVIQLVWSEPVRLTVGQLTLSDTLGEDTLILKCDTIVSDTSRLVISRSLLPGRFYRTVLLTNHGKDLRGNTLRARDSTDTSAMISFSVIHADSFAVSLSGSSACLDKSVKRKWTFNRFSGGEPVTVNDVDNTFRFDSIPSGKGCIGTFIDFNGNGLPDKGRLLPFTPPEPIILFPDTIEARARWDVEGVELAPCNPCEQKRLQSIRRATEAMQDSTKAK